MSPLPPLLPPCSFGNVDMGVGLRADLTLERDVISYWIQQLRNCKSTMKTGACYGEKNMDDLLKLYAKTGQCNNEAGEEDATALGIDVFLPFIGVILFLCGIAVFYELVHDKKARKAIKVRLDEERRMGWSEATANVTYRIFALSNPPYSSLRSSPRSSPFAPFFASLIAETPHG